MFITLFKLNNNLNIKHNIFYTISSIIMYFMANKEHYLHKQQVKLSFYLLSSKINVRLFK